MECEYAKRKKCDSLYIERYNKLLKENEELKRVLNEIKELVSNYERAEQILEGKPRFQLNKLQEILKEYKVWKKK